MRKNPIVNILNEKKREVNLVEIEHKLLTSNITFNWEWVKFMLIDILQMSQPSFSMKPPSLLKRTCMPCSTIWPTETKLFVIVGTCKSFLMQVCSPSFPNGTSPMCRMGHRRCAEWDAECRLRSLCSQVDPACVSRETILGATSCDVRRQNLRTTRAWSWRNLRSS